VATNLKIVGSNSGIQSIRVHWLLELVTDDNDFSILDQFLDLIYDSGLVPAFEIMGNPFGNLKSFEKQSWSTLVRNLLSRYEGIYGAAEVSQWQFETWNEPDLKNYNTMNWTLAGKINHQSKNEHSKIEKYPVTRLRSVRPKCQGWLEWQS
jgi:L-iduronidase